ncbi:DUF971 domain-containing protein [Nitratireductor rhodophyticola]|uniref:DUF971 domain-containing protein n=1 Tax=Nitratireductor rhodophyticola TaxID=2854036 RepID=A0ABS7R3H5_9HYPH|nr:DUF971 domain-containing protein [Nitratireductor rhodophyticola]MBY8915499.1 DUF971 domain-containing protein [Nitratireductor rhodophyticola]MBY8919432.1 DUF971 domain-containing protein [Nitratireductor rhodophyticola]MEC9246965.1 DUF971 domain-containing protein [Pseudomonadota bacterium]WPZ13379.1 DUF971 domain-containing protein [Nitratireductor rhodophyticola]
MKPPKELRVSKDRSVLTVLFPDIGPVQLSAEMLRVLSPSAEVQGHSPEQRITVPGKRHVTIIRAEPVGNYAVRLVFSDAHQSGIFTWVYLHELATQKDARWQGYLDELEEKGLSRDT